LRARVTESQGAIKKSQKETPGGTNITSHLGKKEGGPGRN